MKVRLYCDVWPGMNPGNVYARAEPYGDKSPYCKRFAFDVEIPDDLINHVDVAIPPECVSIEEVI